MDEFAFIITVCGLYLYYLQILNVAYNKRSIWTHPTITVEERKTRGFFNTVFKIFKEKDEERLKKVVRMGPRQFDLLLNLLKDKLTKTSNREPINAECRLALTLLYLAQGAPRQVLTWAFRLGVSTVAGITLETCEFIWQELSSIYLTPPNENEWKKISEDFLKFTGLPNCVGAIDGKHINMKCPPNSGSLYYNYKKAHSVVLLAACDANYMFTLVDIGAYGSQNDGGIFAASSFGKRILNNSMNLPPPKEFPNSGVTSPHFFVADAAFPLKTNLMRPYPGLLLPTKRSNFNKALSRARCRIENTFGILAARWRIFLNTINCSPANVDKIMKAAVVLHNFTKFQDDSYCPSNFVDNNNEDRLVEGLWRREITPLRNCRRFKISNSSREAFTVRETLADYLLTRKGTD